MEAREREAIVRESIDAWNASDWERLKSIWNADGEIVFPEGWPEADAFSGWAAMLEQWRRIKDSWAAELIELESIGESVLAHLRWIVRGEASGAPLERMQYLLDQGSARSDAQEAR